MASKTSKEKANFDPKRFGEQVEAFLPEPLRGAVFLPQEGATAEAKPTRVWHYFQQAEAFVARGWGRELLKDDVSLQEIPFLTAAVVAVNGIKIYVERAQASEDERPFLEALPKSNKDCERWMTRLVGRIQENLLKLVAERPELAGDPERYILEHLVAWALMDMERDLDQEQMAALSPERSAELLRKYILGKGYREKVAWLAAIYAFGRAHLYLDVLDLKERPLPELRQFLGILEPSKSTPVPNAFPDGMGAIPNNPLLAAGLAAIFKGGKLARLKMGGWIESAAGTPLYEYRGSKGGRILVYPNPRRNATDLLPTTETLWRFVESLNPFTADVALAVLAQMVEPTHGDRPKYPLLQPVRITADAILRYKGIQRYGRERRLLQERIYEEMERLRTLYFDVERLPVWDPESGKWKQEGASWQGDRLFDIVKVERYQPSLFGDREVIEVEWSVRAGHWAYWWLNAQGRVWIARMARVLLELDHRDNRGAAVMAKKIGQRVTLLGAVQKRDGPLEMHIRTLLEDVGELLEPEARDKDWARRTRERFDEAMLKLQEAGVFASVEWPDGYGPGDPDRARGWVEKWLSARVRITLPEAPPELPEPAPIALPVTRRQRRARLKLPSAEQRIDGDALRRARMERKLSQEELARLLGISASYLSQVENGRRMPSEGVARKIRTWLASGGT